MSKKFKLFYLLTIYGIIFISISDVTFASCANQKTTCRKGLSIDHRFPACGAYTSFLAMQACATALYVHIDKEEACKAGFSSCLGLEKGKTNHADSSHLNPPQYPPIFFYGPAPYEAMD